VAQQKNISAGCSKRSFSKAAASEVARRTLRYVEPLSDARTPLADFFNILLGACPTEPTCFGYERAVISRYGVVRGRKLVICRLLIYYPIDPGGMDPVK
jgi:Putative membrane protein insertion efficiency factor